MFKHKEERVECSEIIKLLSPYQDYELGESDRIKVEEHLDSCSECRNQFNELEIVLNGINSMSEVVTDENFTGRVMAEVLDYAKSKQSFSMNFVYTFVFALFFLFGILSNPFSEESVTSATGKTDISSFFLQGQKFRKSNISNLAILQFQGEFDEKKVN